MEPEWTDIWYAALKELVGRFGELKCQKARDWQAALKPILYTHRYPAAPQKRPQAENMAPPADPVLEQAPSSLQPRTPRPDIAVSLDAARLGPLDSILKELQEAPPDSGFTYLLSDPCTTAPSGMRFPFFVAELRSSGRAMIEAENRVAVGGSCALSILRSLENGAAADGEDSGLRTYSLTTEGIYASLWQHCYTSEDPQSQQISITPLGLYRVSDRNDSTRYRGDPRQQRGKLDSIHTIYIFDREHRVEAALKLGCFAKLGGWV
ncbi:hypothetical protein UCRNP2_3617 [Neofusicoccum parvum UCRNP2]|uniref:Uncharacterized protein n=1 Tax=Botryosphaeria parva (strain UCR-NP2) TaxID=1287680 RepID=R1EPX6_BOTPV|nr:hypothetical protein UCRNP2_3617 [Neofusicoccum parvum UCRNP2]